jgi:hypothetical protein
MTRLAVQSKGGNRQSDNNQLQNLTAENISAEKSVPCISENTSDNAIKYILEIDSEAILSWKHKIQLDTGQSTY